MAIKHTSEVIKLKAVRLSFPKIWVPEAFQAGQDKRYEATFLLDPSDEEHAKQIKLIEDEGTRIKKMVEEKYGPKGVMSMKDPCYGYADECHLTYDGYEGMFFVRTAQPELDKRTSLPLPKPRIIGRSKEELTPESGKPYAGCYVNTNFTMWLQDNSFGKRINGNLRIIQFVKDGEAFGAGVASVDEMDEVDISDDLEADDAFLS